MKKLFVKTHISFDLNLSRIGYKIIFFLIPNEIFRMSMYRMTVSEVDVYCIQF